VEFWPYRQTDVLVVSPFPAPGYLAEDLQRLTENAGHEIAGHMKMQDMSLQYMTNIVRKYITLQCSVHFF